MGKPVKRSYDASGRQARAQETRHRVIDVAHDLFISRGYGRTTIADIARGADVSVETIYSAFGNKAALLRKVWFTRFRGDQEDVRLVDRPEIQEVLAEPDLVVRLYRHAVVFTVVFRRFVPLHRALEAAAASESSAADMLAEFDAGRLDACSRYAKAAKKTGQLAVSTAECRDVFNATLDGALWHRLVHDGGWSDKRFAAFLGDLWVSALTSS
ncbi:MAG: TetR/AcrR family transcriptional regulator [Aeromicrobium sp.]